MKRLLFSLLAAVLTTMATRAEATDIASLTDAVYVEPVSIAAGSQQTLSIRMKNSISVQTIQFKLYLPDGITIVPNDDNELITASKERTNKYSFFQSTLQSDGAVSVLAQSTTTNIAVGEGEIATVTVQVSEGMAIGDHEVSVKEIILVSKDNVSKEADCVITNLTVTPAGETVYTILDETSTAIPEATTAAVDIKVLRTIKTNEWNTICLPFAMTGAQVTTAFGSDVQLADFIDYDVNDDATLLTVNFDMINPTDGMEANYPYLIKISKPQNMTEFTAKAVIEPAEDDAVVEYDNGKSGSRRQVYGTFKGTYHAQTVVPENCLFISEDKFWYSTGATKMKAYRAYFDFVDILSAVENPSSRIVMSFDDDTTGITNTNSTNDTNEWYTVSGVKVEKPVRKGLYIQNGKKKVVK